MKTPLLLTLILILLRAISAQAVDVFVNNTASCPGTGATGTPYCSIQNALNNAAAGQTIKIRTGTGVYSGVNFISGRSGTAANPITLTKDSGANFILRNTNAGIYEASIQIKEADYWTVDGLTFDANGVTPSLVALKIQCETRNCVGLNVRNNTIKNWRQSASDPWGSNGLDYAGCNPDVGGGCGGVLRTISGIIENNVFQDNDHQSIQVQATLNTIIRNNDISGQRCGGTNYTNNIGIAINFRNFGLQVYGNKIHDAQSFGSCQALGGGVPVTAGIWCDVGYSDENSTIRHNKIWNLDSADHSFQSSHFSVGIFVEAHCENYNVHHNVIYNIGDYGIVNSRHSAGGITNTYAHNTIFNTGAGFCLKEGTVTWRNNVVKTVIDASVVLDCNAEVPNQWSFTANYNQYDDSASQTKVGVKNGVVYNLANWRTQTGQEANSATGNPLFISTTGGSENFALQSTSPAIDSGVNLGMAFNGSAPDKGAFETVAFQSCSVEDGDASKVRVLFENNVGPPIQITNVTGVTIQVASGDRTVSAPAVVGSNRIDFTIDGGAVTNGQAVTFAYTTTGNISDSVLVGNSANQRLNAVTAQNCTNNVGGTPTATLLQTAFRFHGLRGTEAVPIIKPYAAAATNSAVKVAPGGRVRLRINIECTGDDCPATAFGLQYNLNGGGWVDVPDAFGAGNIRFVGTATLVGVPSDGTITTAQLGANNKPCLLKRTASTTPGIALLQNEETECEYALEFDTDITPGDSWQLRIANLQTYSNTPSLTAVNAASRR